MINRYFCWWFFFKIKAKIVGIVLKALLLWLIFVFRHKIQKQIKFNKFQPYFVFIDTQSLMKGNRKLRDLKICKICMENDAFITILPCGHLCCCSNCAPAMRKCPIYTHFSCVNHIIHFLYYSHVLKIWKTLKFSYLNHTKLSKYESNRMYFLIFPILNGLWYMIYMRQNFLCNG